MKYSSESKVITSIGNTYNSCLENLIEEFNHFGSSQTKFRTVEFSHNITYDPTYNDWKGSIIILVIK